MINWRARFRNKVWLASFLAFCVGTIFSLLGMFDVHPSISENFVMEIIDKILTILGLIGIIVDPTTEDDVRLTEEKDV